LSISTIEANPKRNYLLQWNLNVQRQITPDLSITAGFIGSHGVHMLIRGDDGNMSLPAVQAPEGLLFPQVTNHPNSTLGIIRYVYWGTDSFYDGLNINVDKRMSHGLQFQFAYTWAKSIDDNSSTIAGDTFGNGLNSLYYFSPKTLRGRSDFNVGQNISINALWALPTPKSLNGFAKAAVGGWQVGGIVKYNNGIPTTVINNGDPAKLANNGADPFGIPDIIPGCDPVKHNFVGGSSPSYINRSCYTLPTVATTSPTAALCVNNFTDAGVPAAPSGRTYCSNLVGNAGRNTLNGPRLVNFDFSATKNNPIHRISETFNVQFRTEIFNIFNHSNFNPPSPGAGAGIFVEGGGAGANGELDSLSTQPRDVQFAIKVIW